MNSLKIELPQNLLIPQYLLWIKRIAGSCAGKSLDLDTVLWPEISRVVIGSSPAGSRHTNFSFSFHCDHWYGPLGGECRKDYEKLRMISPEEVWNCTWDC